MVRIDAHQHYWQIAAHWHDWPAADDPALFCDFGPNDLAPELVKHAITGTVLVQAQPNDSETDWMLDLADRTPSVLGVVGWVDLTSPAAPARLAALARRPRLRGIRPMLQALPPDWILNPAAAPALCTMADLGLVLDALVRPAHLHALSKIAIRHPALSIVVDHAAKPDFSGSDLSGWSTDLARLAEHANTACKLSGLVTEAGPGWCAEQLRGAAAAVLSAFGPARVLWGSDWPVLLPQSSYGAWIEAAHALVPSQQHAAIFGDNAARIYSLPLASFSEPQQG